MYCKDCKFNKGGDCVSEKIGERSGDDDTDDQLIYSYDEGGGFEVGDYFGCVHFESRVD